MIGRFIRGFAVAAGIALVAAPVTASAETRTLDLYYTHTKERLTITFKKNGRYIPAALKELNRFLRDWRRNEPTNMDPRLFDAVWEIYRRSGSRQPVHVVSAYRSPATNNMLRSRSKAVAKHSQHTLGKALDFFLPDVRASKLRELGVVLQQGGVGYYPSANNPFVHIDVGSVRAWPRMTRGQLVKLFPDGKTVHLPSDGKPLPGYEVALAELKRKGAIARPLAMAEDGSPKKKGGLLAMLFGDEEDETEELNAATTTGQVLTAAASEKKPAAPAPAAVKQPVVAATAPRPPKAPEPPPVTTLATATLPATPSAPPAAPEIAPAERIVAATPPPTPRGKPAELLALVAAATVAPASVTADVVADDEIVTASIAPSVMPRPRPEVPAIAAAPEVPPAIVVASAAPSVPADARQALADVAGDPLPAVSPTALGYASAFQGPPAPVRSVAEQSPRLRTARLSETPAAFGLESGQADPLSPLPAVGAVADPLAVLTALGEPVGIPVYDAAQSTFWDGFAQFVHPNQRHVEAFFSAPATVVVASFGQKPYPGMTATRFTGDALPRLQTMNFKPRRDVAMR